MEISGLETPEPQILLAEEISTVRSVLGSEYTDSDIIQALNACGNNPNRAINALLDSPKQEVCIQPVRSNAPVSSFVKKEFPKPQPISQTETKVKEEKPDKDLDSQKGQDLPFVKKEQSELTPVVKKEQPEFTPIVKKEQPDFTPIVQKETNFVSKEEETSMSCKKDDYVWPLPGESLKEYMKRRRGLQDEEKKRSETSDVPLQDLTTSHPLPYLNPRPIRAIRPPDCVVSDRRLQVIPDPDEAELGDFPEEDDWLLVGKAYVPGLSTCRGKKLLDAGEVVHFAFPATDRDFGGVRIRAKTAAAFSTIVRFSTKRSGEIGKLPPEWTRCLVPLVNSSKVKVSGRCVFPTVNLNLMQEVLLYVSFYIHISVFIDCDKAACEQIAPSDINSRVHPLATLINMLKIKPIKGAEFTRNELNSRKRPLHLRDDMYDLEMPSQIVGSSKKRKGGEGETYTDLDKDEQAISQASLNKLVGTADNYNLAEAEPPRTLVCKLKPYQKQALYWMSGLEKGVNVEEASKTLHPCWSSYKLIDQRAPAVYVNVFSGEATTQFPSVTQTTRGGILADAMGLGKTVMTIALVLSNPRGENSEFYDSDSEDYIKGGTLIVCPMALLGQWKDEFECHAKPGSLSVFVHYGGDRTTETRLLTRHHVVLTTYGVLSSAYKPGAQENSIFHKINWYRVVLDEAHTIKSSKTKVAQAAFALRSHCRWCLTGTPLQNNLEDLYSLLCFLHVKPWCNWDWWSKLIQRPYENGEERGLNLVKAILRSLMLRRTKETKDKEGRPILVLPPVDVQVVECEPSEAERDFYQALFRRSQVKFDQFVAQGKVLHNYASILELLLRLRQCCNHPFLVMSQASTREYTDLDKLARCFLDISQTNSIAGPTPAYVEEVVENLRQGVVTECPICLESASDDPVLTPCAHRLCRECLLASWQTPLGGPCPICRRLLNKSDLITCPTENRFQVDVENQWKESCKVAKLIRCLEGVQKKKEKSIVFSQWTGFLDLLEIPLRRKNIGFLRFDGKLQQKQREQVLKEFNESRDKLVLLMSLRVGGVGLNLTAASNVFLTDPWWNPAVEEQAIMRIHRIGQKKQVQVRRFIVKDSVEERMQQVQDRKQRMISGALTDDEVRTARIEELKMLFK
ncbi:hypothetical protein LUZ63_001675 [Rhynchospora breviuscula]|uniref:DNA repair protein RAD5 n=1 Tax=Rhynchospora breviuscula TaxID=2022672 RepID=A0A9Q0CXE5_9POAL|nr:hypothetical protein LUZ63_001675 [Rhynchospora breviuscula]